MLKTYKVYVHTVPNGKKYVGYTGNSLKARWGNGKNYKQHKYFYTAIQKYGWENIKHEVLFETNDKELALQKEIEYIKLYKSNDRKYGYNNSIGGESGFNGGRQKKEYVERLKSNCFLTIWTKEHLSKAVAQYDLDGNLIACYKSMSEASLITEIARATIERNCKNEVTKPNKYFWEYCENNCVKEKIDKITKIKPRKDNKLFTYNGKTQTVKEWAKEYGIRYETLLQRLCRRKTPIDIALNTPICTNKIPKKYKKEL